ncbi:MAG: metal ABC transporter substrate-binding protein [Leptolyngbya sp. LCM1.Bin17]|nr:MAG: metal ABC transporter substrate-binding protein [Leptolyngbya sp. LCM1.Bin17]
MANAARSAGAVLLITTLSLLGSARPGLADRPRVVASHSVLCDLVEQIATDTIDLTCLMQPGDDPHVYQARPSDRRAIETADLVFYGGYNFEPSIIDMIVATPNSAPKVAVGAMAVPNPIMGEHHHHGHDHGHDHSHDHGQGPPADEDVGGPTLAHDHDHSHDHGDGGLMPDPHVWHNARHGISMVLVIRRYLIDLVPDQRRGLHYHRNAQAIVDQLEVIDQWINDQIATIPAEHRTLVTTHDALAYYGDAYGLTIESALGSISTEASPSAARIAEMVDLVKALGVPTVFAEATSNPQLMTVLAREANVTLSDQPLHADTLGEPGTAAATYQGMLVTNTCTIVEGLGGQCDTGLVETLISPAAR